MAKSGLQKFTDNFKKTWQLYLLLGLPVIFLAVFSYYPMYGALLAFKKFRISMGILGSPWADQFGMANFIRFFRNYNFWNCLWNTFFISIYSILANFPFSIMLALSLNYVYNEKFKKLVQLVSYSPYFISTIVIVGMINVMFNSKNGVFGMVIDRLTGTNVLASAEVFPSLYVWTGVWQNVGFGAIIYIAVLASVDVQVHEAAMIDGATVLQRIRYIDLPAIMPTATILLILNMGSILGVGYEKILAMQNANNLSASEVISTYTYKIGLVSQIPDYSYATAIGLFQSAVGLVLLVTVNRIAAKMSGDSLW